MFSVISGGNPIKILVLKRLIYSWISWGCILQFWLNNCYAMIKLEVPWGSLDNFFIGLPPGVNFINICLLEQDEKLCLAHDIFETANKFGKFWKYVILEFSWWNWTANFFPNAESVLTSTPGVHFINKSTCSFNLSSHILCCSTSISPLFRANLLTNSSIGFN